MISQEYMKKFLELTKHEDFVKFFSLWFNHRKQITKETGIDFSAVGRLMQVMASMKYGYFGGETYGNGLMDMVTLSDRVGRVVKREAEAKKDTKGEWLLG